jgi:hypothetical protein
MPNPCIPILAPLLASNESPGALATIIFDHYTALSSNSEKDAFVIALIGELLVARSLGGDCAMLSQLPV